MRQWLRKWSLSARNAQIDCHWSTVYTVLLSYWLNTKFRLTCFTFSGPASSYTHTHTLAQTLFAFATLLLVVLKTRKVVLCSLVSFLYFLFLLCSRPLCLSFYFSPSTHTWCLSSPPHSCLSIVASLSSPPMRCCDVASNRHRRCVLRALFTAPEHTTRT